MGRFCALLQVPDQRLRRGLRLIDCDGARNTDKKGDQCGETLVWFRCATYLEVEAKTSCSASCLEETEA